jgi:hypothetical protein
MTYVGIAGRNEKGSNVHGIAGRNEKGSNVQPS